jgi:O-antigen/teichoic acid export membrane protein
LNKALTFASRVKINLIRIISNSTLLKNFSVLTISSILSQFFSVFAGIKIARSLNPVLFGTYNLLQLYISIFAVISSFGLRNIIIRNIARDATQVRSIFLITAKLRIIGFVLSVILFCSYIFFNGQYEALLLFLVLLGILSSIVYDLFESIAFGLEKMEFSGIINMISSFLWLAIILLIPKAELTLQLLFGLFVLFSSLRTIVYFFSIYKIGILNEFKFEHVKKDQMIGIVKESFPFYYLALFTLLSNQIPLLFLEYRSGVAQIGFFNIASKVLMPINLVISTAFAAIFPNLSRLFISSYGLFIRNIKLIFLLMAIFGIIGAFGVMLFRKEFIILLYGQQYISSSLVLGYQVWYVAIYAIVCLIGTILTVINKQKQLGYLSIVCTIIQVPILWYGSKFGAEYLSAAFLLATAIILVIHVFVINSYLKKDLSLNFYFKIFALFIIGYIISLLIPINLALYYKILIFLILLFVTVGYLYVNYKTKISKIFF